MQILNPQFDLSCFLDALSQAERPVLLLDYDGTLAPFRNERDRAVPYAGIRELLADILNRNRSRVVIISGRTVDDLLPLLTMDPVPEIWGSHGLERLRPDGTRAAPAAPAAALRGLEQIRHWIDLEHLAGQSELKPSGAAFHWRGLPRSEALKLSRKVEERWAREASEFGMELHEFDGGIELRVAGITKADAVRAIMAESADTVPIAYFGDDSTDEDAFGALGQRGMSVLVRPERRETAADLWITPPDELLDILRLWP